jgi:hypothetical protein
MLTFSGVKFWPLDPRADEIRFTDICHALSQICRFGGQTRVFYSVGEHCVRVAHMLMVKHKSRELALWGLVHDAAEAYLGDVIRPLKTFFPAYKVVEEKVLKAITKKLELPWPEPAEVKKADNVLLACEARDLMPPGIFEATKNIPEKPDPRIKIEPVGPNGAKFMWEVEFKRFFGKTVEEVDRE